MSNPWVLTGTKEERDEQAERIGKVIKGIRVLDKVAKLNAGMEHTVKVMDGQHTIVLGESGQNMIKSTVDVG